jgi:alkyl hydroperoxide reductase subunit AhpC
MGWLGELAKHTDELQQRDIGVVAIAADSVGDMAALQATLAKLMLLTDLDLSVTTAWGLHVPGAETPSPGTFVVGRDGLVQWRRLEDKRGDWPTYPELAAALP